MLEYTFYDNEATGVSFRHDQITQFAGITCDETFSVKDELTVHTRLLPYVVPHPQALAVTGKTVWDISAATLPSEYEASGEILKFLTPPREATRVFVTYNGLSYDDELLRTTFYRNLREPYFNTGRNCIKIDLLDIARFVCAVKPGCIATGTKEDGSPSFKLESICPANGIPIVAHDALGDAIATKALFELIHQRAPWAIEIAMDCGNATKTEDRLKDLISSGELIVRFTSFGKPDLEPLRILATNGKKKFIGLDVRYNEYPINRRDIADVIFTKDSPFAVITSNKSPILLSRREIKSIMGTDLPSYLADGITEINVDAEFINECRDSLSLNGYADANGASSENQIYSGFFDYQDKQRMLAFHSAESWTEKANVRFRDPRLADFSARIILEAVKTGEAKLPADVISSLAIDCSNAFCRPFGPRDADYTTIASSLEHGADSDWAEWAREYFGDHPVFYDHTLASEQRAMEPQLGFKF